MNKSQLRVLLDAEIGAWSAKSYDQLIVEVADVVTVQRGDGAGAHQFEVILLDKTDDYIHISIAIDDGSFLRAFAPLTMSVIVHKDGRVEV